MWPTVHIDIFFCSLADSTLEQSCVSQRVSYLNCWVNKIHIAIAHRNSCQKSKGREKWCGLVHINVWVIVGVRQGKNWRRFDDVSRPNSPTYANSWTRRVYSWRSCRRRWTNARRSCRELWIGQSTDHSVDWPLISNSLTILYLYCHHSLSDISCLQWLLSFYFRLLHVAVVIWHSNLVISVKLESILLTPYRWYRWKYSIIE